MRGRHRHPVWLLLDSFPITVFGTVLNMWAGMTTIIIIGVPAMSGSLATRFGCNGFMSGSMIIPTGVGTPFPLCNPNTGCRPTNLRISSNRRNCNTRRTRHIHNILSPRCTPKTAATATTIAIGTGIMTMTTVDGKTIGMATSGTKMHPQK